MTPFQFLFVGGLSLVMGACSGTVSGPGESQGRGSRDDASPSAVRPPDLPACLEDTFDVYEALFPTCAGCHQDGTSQPMFSSVTAFTTLVVSDPAFVVPGSPTESSLVALLEGRGDGAFAQMPLGSSSFAQLESAGKTEIGVSEVRQWITDLVPCSGLPSTSPPLVGRLRAPQILRSLEQQLGLRPEEYLDRQGYPILNPLDSHPAVISRIKNAGRENWIAFGGAHVYHGIGPDSSVTEFLAMNFAPLSQTWCRFSVEDDSNGALFSSVDRDAPSSTHAGEIRDNIEALYLRILGTKATSEEVDFTYRTVFQHYEALEDPRTAWVGVCAALLRDPLWISY